MENFVDTHIQDLKEKYPEIRSYDDFHVFTLLCIKYFFYAETEESFDMDLVRDYLTDGAKDGGIDAIFNDPTSETNDVIIVQSKYYDKTKLTNDVVLSSIGKIVDTLKDLQNNKIKNYSEHLVSAYRNATSEQDEDGNFRIYFFTSYNPRTKKERNKLEKSLRTHAGGIDTEFAFGDDIDDQISLCEAGKMCVDCDKLEIDDKNNCLKYENSIIVNVSAKSLQILENKRRNGILGMNLRYYVRQKAVDSGIEDTIEKDPEDFWYRNNGIVVVCDNYKIDGKEVKLFNFSIVNGGQTTHQIGRLDLEKDFYLQCKIVKKKGSDDDAQDSFVNSIAEATNSQKPIKKADLKANTPEQLRLKQALQHEHVYYITKKGDSAPKQYTGQPYQTTNLAALGKLGLATILQMPGSARSNSQKMYNEKYYHLIFGGNVSPGVFADALKMDYYYKTFLKSATKEKGYSKEYDLPMLKNGKTFQLACITLLSKIEQNIINYDDVENNLDNIDALKDVLSNSKDMPNIIVNKLDDEKTLFNALFKILCLEVLVVAYIRFKKIEQGDSKTVNISNFLKNDVNYYRSVIPALWQEYNSNDKLKSCINKLCGSK